MHIERFAGPSGLTTYLTQIGRLAIWVVLSQLGTRPMRVEIGMTIFEAPPRV